MDDMASTIIPKSDQLNSDDLITGPITITITGVDIRSGQEQPISIHYEGDGGIRISHMSDIDESMTMALTVTRANKKPFTVKPIVKGAPKAAAPKTPEPSAGTILNREDQPSAAAAPLTADQVIDVSDRLKPIMRGKERLLNAAAKKLQREFTS